MESMSDFLVTQVPFCIIADTTNKFYQPPSDTDLVPPLELCIRTKYVVCQIGYGGI